MRHRKTNAKLGRTTSHRRCMFANMLKSLVTHGSVTTTVEKAKELRRHAERLITLAKKNNLASRRIAKARMMVRHNVLDSKEARSARAGNTEVYNDDRLVIERLFAEFAPRFATRAGGYTRITKTGFRRGDNAAMAVLEFLKD